MKFFFSNQILNTDTRELSRSDMPISLEPQVFDLLTYLIKNRERVVSKDDLIATIKGGDAFTSGVVFFPMHRVERMELDLPESNILSLSQRFAQQTGQDPAPLLTGEFLARGRE